MSRKVKRITVQLLPEHVQFIKEALRHSQRHIDSYDYGQSEEMRAFGRQRREETSRLRSEIFLALSGKAIRPKEKEG